MTTAPTLLIRLFVFASLLALAACGSSSSGGTTPPPPPADTTAPNVSAATVPAGSTLNRVVALTATATDAGGIAEVRFIVDGTVIGTDTTSPYSFDWDTSTVADGTYTLTVAADDNAGNTAQSAGISVTVDNVVQFLVALSGDEADIAHLVEMRPHRVGVQVERVGDLGGGQGLRRAGEFEVDRVARVVAERLEQGEARRRIIVRRCGTIGWERRPEIPIRGHVQRLHGIAR